MCLLCSPTLWARYPVLCLIRLLCACFKSFTLVSYVVIMNVLGYYNGLYHLASITAIALIVAPLFLNYIVILYFGLVAGRMKVFFYPILHIFHPIFQWTVTV